MLRVLASNSTSFLLAVFFASPSLLFSYCFLSIALIRITSNFRDTTLSLTPLRFPLHQLILRMR
jgi:hypothetical protein